MALIVEGRLMALVVLVVSFALFYFYMYQGKQGTVYRVRTLPAMAAIPEAVGRAAEMGRPLYWTTGIGGGLSSSEQGPQILASVSILSYIAEECIKAGVEIAAFSPVPDAYPLVEETLRTAYMAQGKADEFDTGIIHFISGQSAYLSGTLGYFQRERPASNILMGGFYYESVVIGEAGSHIGALQIGGTANTHQMPFMIATCDYMLLSEELYAAGASISQDPDLLGTIRGEDILKYIFIGVTIVGFLLGFGRMTFLMDLLGL